MPTVEGEIGVGEAGVKGLRMYCIMHYTVISTRMANARVKDHPLSLRLPQADVALIDRAAKMKGSSRTEFMRDAAVREAEMLILDRTMITMSAEGFKALMDEIDSPAKPIPEMVELLKRKAPWEKT